MALVTAMMALLMMLALGAGVAVTTATASAIAAHHRDGIQALYAAEAGIALAVVRLRAVDDWRTIVSGPDTVTMIDGRLADLLQGGSVDSRSALTVTVAADPGGDDTVLVMHSSATLPGSIRRTVQATVQRRPASSEIEVTWWR